MVNRKYRLIFASLCLAFATTGQAHEHPVRADAPAVAADVALAPAPPLAARYTLRSNALKTEWFLWRDADTIETADLATGQNNIWERLGSGDYANIRVFNQEQRIVEYLPGELKTRNVKPDWSKLASIVSPQLLATLKRGSSKQLFGQMATRYTGQQSDQKIELWWLNKAQLPARLKITGEHRQLDMTLLELQSSAPDVWPRATESRIASYQKIDASDLGDMESDPFVARLMRQEGHEHRH